MVGSSGDSMNTLIVKPILQALVEHADLIEALPDLLDISAGTFVYVPPNMVIDDKIIIKNDKNAPNSYNLIILSENSAATIIEEYCNIESATVNNVTKIILADNANLTHYKMQLEDETVIHTGRIVVNQAARSHFSSHLMSMGAKTAINDLTVHLQGTAASCYLNGLYAPRDGQKMEQNTVVYHEDDDCTSEQDYKGVLKDCSKAVFNGRVVVNKDVQNTVAKQQNKNLLLSKLAQVETKPQLEIYADNVVCTHGATVGQLDEDALFYFATRGIGFDEASNYLIQAFAKNNLQAMPDKILSQQMQELMEL